jgi:predicted metal-dependent hydrolase
VSSQEGWLQSRLAQIEPAIVPAFGELIPVEGRLLLLETGAIRIRQDGERLLIGGKSEQVPAKLRAYLRTLARDRLVGASEAYAD